MQKISKIAAYALSGLFVVALASHAGAQTINGSNVTYTNTFATGLSTATNNSGSGSLSLFDGQFYYLNNGVLTQDPLIGVTLSLTGVTNSSGTLTNTSATTTESYTIQQLVSLQGNSANNDLAIAAFNSQFQQALSSVAPGATVNYGGTGTGTGTSATKGSSTVLSDFTGSGTFTVNFKTGQVFTGVTGGTDYTLTGVPTEDVIGSVTYSLQFAPVPELSSSLGLAALVLGGSVLGLRARRRARA